MSSGKIDMTHPIFPCIHCKMPQARGGNAKYCHPCFLLVDKARQRCGAIVSRAKKLGILAAPEFTQCVDCNAEASAYDHRDYRRPLWVFPVCGHCNIKRGPALPFSRKWEPKKDGYETASVAVSEGVLRAKRSLDNYVSAIAKRRIKISCIRRYMAYTENYGT